MSRQEQRRNWSPLEANDKEQLQVATGTGGGKLMADSAGSTWERGNTAKTPSRDMQQSDPQVQHCKAVILKPFRKINFITHTVATSIL